MEKNNKNQLIRNSKIGKNVKLGNDVTIINSTITGDTEIGSRCLIINSKISNSSIGFDSNIYDSNLKDFSGRNRNSIHKCDLTNSALVNSREEISEITGINLILPFTIL